MMTGWEQGQAHAEPQASIRVPCSFPCDYALAHGGLGASKLGMESTHEFS